MMISNVWHRKTVLFLAFLLQGLMATVAHAVGVGGSCESSPRFPHDVSGELHLFPLRYG